jgi:twitching motility protein PilT
MARIDALLDVLLEKKGSDLHLAAGHPPLARRDGELEPLRREPLDAAEIQELLGEILSDEQQRRLAEDLALDFAYVHGDAARFRGHGFHKSTGLAATFHAIPAHVPTLDELGYPELFRRLCERRAGLVLAAGPTGSGKSTTLAAMVDHINRTRACHVLTIEAPVEILHRPQRAQITQREVGPDVASFAAALRSAGREDVDVILVSELRTPEVMKLALVAASSGALVLASVRAGGATGALDRILHAFPNDEQPQVRGMLAESLAAVVAQQLLRTADGKGRAVAHEILLGSTALASMIREGKTSQVQSLMAAGQAVGMQTMDMALERLVQGRVVSGDEALEHAADRDAFQRLVARRTAPPAG